MRKGVAKTVHVLTMCAYSEGQSGAFTVRPGTNLVPPCTYVFRGHYSLLTVGGSWAFTGQYLLPLGGR